MSQNIFKEKLYNFETPISESGASFDKMHAKRAAGLSQKAKHHKVKLFFYSVAGFCLVGMATYVFIASKTDQANHTIISAPSNNDSSPYQSNPLENNGTQGLDKTDLAMKDNETKKDLVLETDSKIQSPFNKIWINNGKGKTSQIQISKEINSEFPLNSSLHQIQSSEDNTLQSSPEVSLNKTNFYSNQFLALQPREMHATFFAVDNTWPKLNQTALHFDLVPYNPKFFNNENFVELNLTYARALKNIVKISSTQEIERFSHQLGSQLLVGKQWRNGVQLATGFSVGVHNGYNSLSEINTSQKLKIDTTVTIIKFPGMPDRTLTKYDTSIITQQKKNIAKFAFNYQKIAVPISVRYILGTGKISARFSTTIAPGIFIQKNGTWISNKGESNQASTKTIFSTDLQAGTGLQYNLKKNILYLELNGTWQQVWNRGFSGINQLRPGIQLGYTILL